MLLYENLGICFILRGYVYIRGRAETKENFGGKVKQTEGKPSIIFMFLLRTCRYRGCQQLK